ncbi:hypothetical protein [Guillardia theta]|uniref:Uncharacterized protein n=1 Tax=Guillardia theta TaxID=55529 RepID=Q9AW12_GUITH|nr:hypothetical protein GTHECHR2165 [Guillardia theta]CAC27059.1 hypothetical protein [Guillardia theta]
MSQLDFSIELNKYSYLKFSCKKLISLINVFFFIKTQSLFQFKSFFLLLMFWNKFLMKLKFFFINNLRKENESMIVDRILSIILQHFSKNFREYFKIIIFIPNQMSLINILKYFLGNYKFAKFFHRDSSKKPVPRMIKFGVKIYPPDLSSFNDLSQKKIKLGIFLSKNQVFFSNSITHSQIILISTYFLKELKKIISNFQNISKFYFIFDKFDCIITQNRLNNLIFKNIIQKKDIEISYFYIILSSIPFFLRNIDYNKISIEQKSNFKINILAYSKMLKFKFIRINQEKLNFNDKSKQFIDKLIIYFENQKNFKKLLIYIKDHIDFILLRKFFFINQLKECRYQFLVENQKKGDKNVYLSYERTIIFLSERYYMSSRNPVWFDLLSLQVLPFSLEIFNELLRFNDVKKSKETKIPCFLNI